MFGVEDIIQSQKLKRGKVGVISHGGQMTKAS